MPYVRDGLCVYKKNSDGTRGKKVGCSDSVEEAKKYMAKLYMIENEEKEMDEKAVWSTASVNNLPDSSFLYIEPGGKKDSEGKTEPRSLRHFPYKDASGKVDLPHLRNAISRLGQPKTGSSWKTKLSSSKRASLQKRAQGILSSNKEMDKEFKINAANILDKIKSWFLAVPEEDEEIKASNENKFMVWKSKSHEGRLAWAATYSNNFRDRDNPPEIISEQSHLQFEKSVDSGEYPPPELWFWHVKEWKFGDATWVGYDDSGFAMAGGLVDEGKEWFAKAISQIPLLVSHGMPVSEIERDPNDKSIITKHRTAEVSPLPADYAANLLTGWMLLKEDAMPINADKRQALIDTGLIDPDKLEALENSNIQREQKGIDEELERKETEEEPEVESPAAEDTEEVETVDEPGDVQDVEAVEEVPADEVVEETKSQDEPETQPSFSLEDVAAAVASAIKPMSDRLGVLEQEIKALKQADDQKVEERVKSLPSASAQAIIAKAIQSAVSSEETIVDGRTSLAKAAPKQAEDKPEERPGTFVIPFVRDWMNEEKQASQ